MNRRMQDQTWRVLAMVTAGILLGACDGAPTSPERDLPEDGAGSTNIGASDATCPAPAGPDRVLVDATHDGGLWWFPQSQAGPFLPEAPHQGLALAAYLRNKGYTVDEIGRGTAVTKSLLLSYAVVLRAGNYGATTGPETDAYAAFASCARTLLLFAEFLRAGEHDAVAERVGVPLTGTYFGTITQYAPHPITAGARPLPYIAGSYLSTIDSDKIEVLGTIDGRAVMGVLRNGPAKVFFIGDGNGLQEVPRPLIDNLIAWGF